MGGGIDRGEKCGCGIVTQCYVVRGRWLSNEEYGKGKAVYRFAVESAGKDEKRQAEAEQGIEL